MRSMNRVGDLSGVLGQIPSPGGYRSLGRWAGVAVSLVALVLAFRSVGLRQVVGVLGQANPVWLAAAFGSALLATVASSARWRTLLHTHKPPLGRLFQAFMISHLGNTILPWKLGTLLRAYLIAEVERVRLGFVVGTVAVERALDGAGLAILLLLVVTNVALPAWLHVAGARVGLVLAALFLSLVAVVVARRHSRFTLAALGSGRGPDRWPKWAHKFAQALEDALRGLDVLGAAGQHDHYFALGLWTLAIWGFGALTNELALRALGITASAWAPLALLVTLQIGNKVPAAPANIGVFHYVAVLTLGLFGVEPGSALSYALLLHAVVFLGPAVVGGLCLWLWQRSYGQLHLTRLAEQVRGTLARATS